MEHIQLGHTEPRPPDIAGSMRKRMLPGATAAGAIALAAACLRLPLAVPLALLTTLGATAVGLCSRLIAIDHG